MLLHHEKHLHRPESNIFSWSLGCGYPDGKVLLLSFVIFSLFCFFLYFHFLIIFTFLFIMFLSLFYFLISFSFLYFFLLFHVFISLFVVHTPFMKCSIMFHLYKKIVPRIYIICSIALFGLFVYYTWDVTWCFFINSTLFIFII